ncbi:MAG: minor capsid protein [Bacteroidetes bacterium]|nr:minor capsid protein [Bacteroidota bacterium]
MSYAVSLFSRFGILPHQVMDFRTDPTKPPGSNSDPTPLISDETIKAAFELPNEGAVQFLRQKGLKVTWDHKAASADTHARAFTVAKVVQADVLQQIYDDVTAALTEGKTFEEFQKELVPKLQSAGWYGKKDVVDPVTGAVARTEVSSRSRLSNIYRTNMQSAYMDARYDQVKAVADVFPYVRIDAIIDDATTQTCIDANGKVYRLDDKGLRLPPYHFGGCRTTFEPMDESELEQLGLKVDDPKELLKGDHPIPPSFDRDPGTPWSPDTTKYAPVILNQLEAAL